MIEMADEIGREHIDAIRTMLAAEEKHGEGPTRAFGCLVCTDTDGYDIPREHLGIAHRPIDRQKDHPWSDEHHPLHEELWLYAWNVVDGDVLNKLKALGFVDGRCNMVKESRRKSSTGQRWRVELHGISFTERGRDFLSRKWLMQILGLYSARANKRIVLFGLLMSVGMGFLSAVNLAFSFVQSLLSQ